MSDVWNPLVGERIAPAWRAAMDLLADDQWHTRSDVVAVMLAASDLQERTCQGQIDRCAVEGLLARRGAKAGRMVKVTTLAREYARHIVGPYT